MHRFIQLLFLTSSALAVPAMAQAAPKVVATIPAVHSIVSGVMGDVGEPHLLVPGGASPHTYSLKPSDARALAESNLVVWVGPQLETFLDGELENMAPDAHGLEFLEVDDIVTHAFRDGGLWEAHAHGDEAHGHDAHEGKDHDDHGHDEHAHDDHHGHDHDSHGHEAHDAKAHDDHDDHDDPGSHDDHAAHEGHGAHEEGGTDVHIWLDPRNAILLSAEVAEELSELDPDNAATYKANHLAQLERLEALDSNLRSTLESVKDKPFIVFHDAYQYFESRYELAGVGSITVSPEVAPGAARVRDIQDRVRSRGAECVFSEPQFRPTILTAVLEGSSARAGVLDPVGAELTPGTDLYAEMMQQLATNMVTCLADPA